jgi:hypothetical protein
VAAIASDLDHSLIIRISTMIAAIVIVSAYRAGASAVGAFPIVIICHFLFSLCS